MATDPKSVHAVHVAREDYRPVASYLRGKMDRFLARGGLGREP